MASSKRFVDTAIWKEDWFQNLPNHFKLFWFYITHECNDAGVWRPNKNFIQTVLGKMIMYDDFLQGVNKDNEGKYRERVRLLPNGRWWIRDYFKFQYGKILQLHSPVH